MECAELMVAAARDSARLRPRFTQAKCITAGCTEKERGDVSSALFRFALAKQTNKEEENQERNLQLRVQL